MNETGPGSLLFERGDIKVSKTRVDAGGESFPIRKIESVETETGSRRLRTGIALVSAGVCALLGGAYTNFPLLLMAGAAFIVGGGMICFARVTRTIVITTRGQRVRALTSTDSKLVKSVVAAVREAIAERK
ncbi:MAG: DUF6232 family protein [Usitatibacteraceae bacterium]